MAEAVPQEFQRPGERLAMVAAETREASYRGRPENARPARPAMARVRCLSAEVWIVSMTVFSFREQYGRAGRGRQLRCGERRELSTEWLNDQCEWRLDSPQRREGAKAQGRKVARREGARREGAKARKLQSGPVCHPERSEGSAFPEYLNRMQIPHSRIATRGRNARRSLGMTSRWAK